MYDVRTDSEQIQAILKLFMLFNHNQNQSYGSIIPMKYIMLLKSKGLQ